MKLHVLFLCAGLILSGAACRKPTALPAPPESTEPPPPSPGISIPTGPAGTPIAADPGSPEHAKVELLTFAAQQFYGINKRMPANLEELVAAKLIPKVPIAPVGMKFLIEPQTKQVRLVKQ